MAEEIAVIVARIDERTQNLDEKLDANLIACVKCIDDHEDRIRSLERWQWKVIGIATGISTVISVATAFVVLNGGA